MKVRMAQPKDVEEGGETHKRPCPRLRDQHEFSCEISTRDSEHTGRSHSLPVTVTRASTNGQVQSSGCRQVGKHKQAGAGAGLGHEHAAEQYTARSPCKCHEQAAHAEVAQAARANVTHGGIRTARI